MTNEILAELYQYLIGKSWESPEAFDAYQAAWESIAEKYNVTPFDWTKGERPHMTNSDNRLGVRR
jgi:hypothetical protein